MTTILFPDVSQYDAGDRIEPGTQVVVARATLSSSIADRSYQDFKQQAASVGAFFVAYHWMSHGSITQQVNWVLAHVGTTPLMLDCEDVAGNTGFTGTLTVADIQAFVSQYRALGGVCHLFYLPHWYWQQMGSPDLAPVAQMDMHLVASEYRPYSEGDWPSAYGHVSPDEWQYTDAMLYGGGHVDFNAFRGTAPDFAAIASGGIMTDGWDQAVNYWGNKGRVGTLRDWVLGDVENVRDILMTTIGKVDTRVPAPQPGSPLALLISMVSDYPSLVAKLDALTATVEAIQTAVAALPTAGWTDADRALAQSVADAVGALNNRLATP